MTGRQRRAWATGWLAWAALACFGGDEGGNGGPSDVAAGGSGNGGTGAAECTGATGDSDCDCYPNQTCNGILVCVGGTCVEATSGSGGESGAGGAPPPGCVPDCAGRTCGPDPVCNTSCGTCTGGGACNTAGQCEVVAPPGGPTFLSFSANTMLLEYQETLVFSAVLTDPDGIDDLIGGTLVDPGSGATYGSFQTSAAEGSYELSVTWTQIDTVITVEATPVGVDRTFRAEFFDQGGNKVTRDLAVKLRCSSPGATTNSYGCCAGNQANWNYYDAVFGGCGGCMSDPCAPVPVWSRDTSYGICSSFRCEWNTTYSTSRVSCMQQCSAAGATCVEPTSYTNSFTDPPSVGFARYPGGNTVYLESCAETPPAMNSTFAFGDMSCSCGTSPVPSWFADLPQ